MTAPKARAIALFLDFDGTLVDIAPRPDAVHVPPCLPALLGRLARRLEGALAVVSGRALEDLDRMLPVALPMAAEHGAALRRDPGGRIERPDLPRPPGAWREAAAAFAASRPGVLLEEKPRGLVLHYRLAPDAGAEARARLLAGAPQDFALLPAHMAWEVRPRAVSKATAVAALMAAPPFSGRVPVFIGDDATDEEGMAECRARGGFGLRLQEAFGTPGVLHRWLAALAHDGDAAGTVAA
jgi:trehalose 6-phosphate phosphatase